MVLRAAVPMCCVQGMRWRAEAHSVQVREVSAQVESLAPVEADLLGAWLEQVVAGDVALQDILGMAPAAQLRAPHDQRIFLTHSSHSYPLLAQPPAMHIYTPSRGGPRMT